MNQFWRFLIGYVRFKTDADTVENIMNLMLRENITVRTAFFDSETLTVEVPYSKADHFVQMIRNDGMNCRKERAFGLVPWLAQYRKRPGILIGALLFAFIMVISGSVIWRVVVEDDAQTDASVVMAILQEEGFGIGCSSTANYSSLAAKCVANHDDIAWLSIQIRGTTATVRALKAKTQEETSHDWKSAANLIAAKDGVVREIVSSRGRVVVKAGDAVKRGDVLVSGVVPAVHSTLFVEAEGEVRGEITETLSVMVPLSFWKKAYQKDRLASLSVNFLGFSINIYKYTGNLPSTYDTIHKKKYMHIGKLIFPFGVDVQTVFPYEGISEQLSDEQAESYALLLLQDKIAETVKNGDLLTLDTSFRWENGCCIATGIVTYIGEMSESVRFSVVE